MSLAILKSSALFGLDTVEVSVEVHVASGLPQFSIVGLPNVGVRESRERVRAAIQNSGFTFPAGRITVNLAPADLPKESSSYDLAIAMCILLASAQIEYASEYKNNPNELLKVFFLGELSLTGTLTPSRGMLAQVLSIIKNVPDATLVLPYSNAQEAQMIPSAHVVGVKTLQEATEYLSYQNRQPLHPRTNVSNSTDFLSLCMSDVRGQKKAKRAVAIAAAGKHNILLSGSPGTGKTMLATRMMGILPELNIEEALQTAAIAELSGVAYQFKKVPFRQPHHTSSPVSIIGGGKKGQLGEITLAHLGVLFLDELPEFNRAVLEALREPLESRTVHIARANYRLCLPSNLQLIGAMNPCQCGWYGHPKKICECNEEQRKKYRMKVSGPLLDRFDMVVHLYSEEVGTSQDSIQRSSEILSHVSNAHKKQKDRQSTYNAHLTNEQIKKYCFLSPEAQDALAQAIVRYSWSERTANKVRVVARTIADYSEKETIDLADVIEAIQLKQ